MILEHHPLVDDFHGDRRILCSVMLQRISLDISLRQRRQGAQEAQVCADTSEEVTTLTEGLLRKHFPDEAIQPTAKNFNSSCNYCQVRDSRGSIMDPPWIHEHRKQLLEELKDSMEPVNWQPHQNNWATKSKVQVTSPK